MKNPEEIANHPKARLHRELVAVLRATGSAEGAEKEWVRMKCNLRRWRRLETYGFGSIEQQLRLNRVAFPACNFQDVAFGLTAGNKLHELYELACGRASIARNSAGQPRRGNKGLIIIRHSVFKN
jgi:hypothetical protein